MLVYGFSVFVSVWGCVWAGDVALAGRSLKAVSSFFLSGYSQHSHSNITSREFWETAGRKPGSPAGDCAHTNTEYQSARMQDQLHKPERNASRTIKLVTDQQWNQISRRFHTPQSRAVQRINTDLCWTLHTARLKILKKTRKHSILKCIKIKSTARKLYRFPFIVLIF